VTFIVGITVIGVALMFGKGSAWVASVGDDRVAAGLAQEWIEKVRARGWSAATDPGLNVDGTPDGTIGKALVETSPSPAPPGCEVLGWRCSQVTAGNGHGFIRRLCVQYVNPTGATWLAAQPYDPQNCLAGDVTSIVRITVEVRGTNEVGVNPLDFAMPSPVTLQAWMMLPQS